MVRVAFKRESYGSSARTLVQWLQVEKGDEQDEPYRLQPPDTGRVPSVSAPVSAPSPHPASAGHCADRLRWRRAAGPSAFDHRDTTTARGSRETGEKVSQQPARQEREARAPGHSVAAHAAEPRRQVSITNNRARCRRGGRDPWGGAAHGGAGPLRGESGPLEREGWALRDVPWGQGEGEESGARGLHAGRANEAEGGADEEDEG